MKHPKATAWGAGVMGAAGLLGTLLGPSPLVLPFVPLISLAHAPFAIAMAAVGLPGGVLVLSRFVPQERDAVRLVHTGLEELDRMGPIRIRGLGVTTPIGPWSVSMVRAGGRDASASHQRR